MLSLDHPNQGLASVVIESEQAARFEGNVQSRLDHLGGSLTLSWHQYAVHGGAKLSASGGGVGTRRDWHPMRAE